MSQYGELWQWGFLVWVAICWSCGLWGGSWAVYRIWRRYVYMRYTR